MATLVSVSQILISPTTTPPCKPSPAEHFVVEELRDVLGGRVQLVERRNIVQELVIQPVDHSIQNSSQIHEIHQQPGGIQLARRPAVTCTR